jgi:RNA polymerase sigma factor (sigma-70 family)
VGTFLGLGSRPTNGSGECSVQPLGSRRTLLVVDDDAGSDEVLWSRAVKADGEAFGLLFDRHRERVFRHCVRLVASRQDAEDVVAVAFLEMWRSRRTVRLVGGSTLPWLLVTATNVSRNVERGTRRYRTLLARLDRGDRSPDPAVVLGDAGALGMSDGLDAALASLGDTDRQLLRLVVIDGFSLTEAADQLGLTVSAAKSRMHRSRSRLRQDLADSNTDAPFTTGADQ